MNRHMMSRSERRRAEERFKQEEQVYILLATDAAGEGINLQRAHLMINYDLPWNPNRLEQRFGRIHRIGQSKVCHLWNLVAIQTREGQVFERLLANVSLRILNEDSSEKELLFVLNDNLTDWRKIMSILVTGGAGYIDSDLVY